MRTYFGSRQGNRSVVMVVDDNNKGRKLEPAPSQAVFNHSPNGFEWGYGGSGPAQLALGILLDHVGSTEVDKRHLRETAPSTAERFYQMFKCDFVATWGDTWKVTSAEIDNWLRTQISQAETKRTQYSHEPVFPKYP